jgi:hypothetical protein
MPKIRVKTTITVISEVPYDKNYYPNDIAETLVEAVAYERDLDNRDVISNFIENIEAVPLGLDGNDDDFQHFEMDNEVTVLDDYGNELDDENVKLLSDIIKSRHDGEEDNA